MHGPCPGGRPVFVSAVAFQCQLSGTGSTRVLTAEGGDAVTLSEAGSECPSVDWDRLGDPGGSGRLQLRCLADALTLVASLAPPQVEKKWPPTLNAGHSIPVAGPRGSCPLGNLETSDRALNLTVILSYSFLSDPYLPTSLGGR